MASWPGVEIVGLLILIAYLPICAYLGAIRGTIAVAWAFLVPWGLLWLDLAINTAAADDPNAEMGALVASVGGLVVCLVAQLVWRGRGTT